MRAAAVLLAALLAAAIVASASAADTPARARAQAVVLTGTLGESGRVETRDGALETDAVPPVDGAALASGRAAATADPGGEHARARASATASGVSLLDGLVTAARVRRTARAATGAATYAGAVEDLRIGGTALGDVADDRTYALPGGAGSVTVNHGAEGLVVELAQAVAERPAGTRVAVATADARAADAVRAAPAPTPAPEPEPGPEAGGDGPAAAPDAGTAEPRRSERRRRTRPSPAAQARRRARAETRRLAAGDFTFPVGGEASVGDDFGGPRQIGPHQGNDIFAAFGSPVLAVADGRVEKVGTLEISGNRLWVRTDEDDTFFYAHLASFSPAARTGRRVTAGTVLGYVGNTGDAEPTPPHLHFEIHPGDGDAIDPHAVLSAWQARTGHADDPDVAARPGALLEVRDLITG